MADLQRAVDQLKQMAAIGDTHSARLDELRESAAAMMKMIPWVPFDRAGKLLTHGIPTDPDDGYEIIRVRTGIVRFPDEPYREFSLPDIRQTVFVLSGSLSVTINGVPRNLLARDSLAIPRGSWVSLAYNNCDCIFYQVPRIAGEDDMRLR